MNAPVAQPAKASQQAIEHYEQQLQQNALGGFTAASDLAACLLPLLKSLGWRGNPRHVAEALPHFANDLDLTGLRNVMAHLNFSSRPEKIVLAELDPRLTPCLFLPDDGHALVVKAVADGKFEVFDSAQGATVTMDSPRMRGTVYFFSPIQADAQVQRVGWFRTILDRFRPLFWQVFFVTLLLNIVSLGTPLFVMSIYDKVIGTGSMSMLASFSVGVCMALVFDGILRAVRARILAFIGARLDNIMGNNIFQH
ncbi:MAG TPA: lantibiotic ABC transporter, partial [Candidatus Omnitrophota bacterium]|nr:lantibiotic ABC transporter [Candidatus Omnitrophota bacterium]